MYRDLGKLYVTYSIAEFLELLYSTAWFNIRCVGVAHQVAKVRIFRNCPIFDDLTRDVTKFPEFGPKFQMLPAKHGTCKKKNSELSLFTLCCFSHMSTKNPCSTELMQLKVSVCTGCIWTH